MARRKAQNLWCSASPFGRGGGRLSARHMRIFWSALSRSALLERKELPRTQSACSFRGVLNSAPGPAFVLCIMRSSRPEAGRAHAESSASSWQDLLVGPGGAPLPPGSFVATKPAGAAPRPAFKTPLERAPQLDEVDQSLTELRRLGIRHLPRV